VAIAGNEAARYDLLVVDAFSSDAIPIHLLTREALAAYAGRLAPGGVMLFHVSNRFFRLRPVLAAAAPLVGFAAFAASDVTLSAAEVSEGKKVSDWVALARPPAARALGAEWTPVPQPSMRVWTDDYSNPIGVMGPAAGP
jgi:hypothetical protein